MERAIMTFDNWDCFGRHNFTKLWKCVKFGGQYASAPVSPESKLSGVFYARMEMMLPGCWLRSLLIRCQSVIFHRHRLLNALHIRICAVLCREAGHGPACIPLRRRRYLHRNEAPESSPPLTLSRQRLQQLVSPA